MNGENNSLNSSFDPGTPLTPPKPSIPEPSMKWHKFLIYFALWASAILNGISAFATALGLHYGSMEIGSMVYDMFPMMRPADIVYGLLLAFIAVYSIMTRFALAGFKEKGPAMLLRIRIFGVVIGLIYPLLASICTELPFGEMLEAPSLIAGIAMYFFDRSYYGKRRHMFVN